MDYDRRCPGRDVAEKTLFITIALSTAVFNISKMKDESGREIEPAHEYTLGLNR